MRCVECGFENGSSATACSACGAGIAPQSVTGPTALADTLAPGTRLRETYEIVGPIGEGGAGMVYAGRHVKLDHRVAIKALFGQHARNDDMRRRFVEEGRLQARFNHPNIVRVTDIIDEPALCAIVMEHVDGPSLDRWLHEAAEPPEPARAVRLILGVLDGVRYAHDHQVVHRDLKPGNILLARTGVGVVPKVTDFGIAKVLSDSRGTATGTMMGTLYYMAPEQFMDAKNVDLRADVYSLGCTLFELLTKRLPFEAESEYALMKAHVEQRPPDPRSYNPAIPAELSIVVLRALEKLPERRWQTCGAFAEAIRLAFPVTGGTHEGDAVSLGVPGVLPHRPQDTTLRIEPGAGAGAAPLRRGGSGQSPAAGGARLAAESPEVRSAPPRASGDHRVPAAGPRSRGERPSPASGTPLLVRLFPWLLAAMALGLVAVLLKARGSSDGADAGAAPFDAGGDGVTDSTVAPATRDTAAPPEPGSEPERQAQLGPALGSGAEADGSGPNSDAAPRPAPETLDAPVTCRALNERYGEIGVDDSAQIAEAIAALDQALDSCRARIAIAQDGAEYDRLIATVEAETMNMNLYRLRAIEAQVAGGNPCAFVLIAATEAQRVLERLNAAIRAGELMEYEITSVAPRRERLAETYRAFMIDYPTCGVVPAPPEVLLGLPPAAGSGATP